MFSNLFAVLRTWLKLIVRKPQRWCWILWKTSSSLHYFGTFSNSVPQLILLTKFMINSESASIITFWRLSCFRNSKHFSRAINSAILLVALPKWQSKMKRRLSFSSLNTPPKPTIIGLSLEAPSMLYFKKPWGEGCQ